MRTSLLLTVDAAAGDDRTSPWGLVLPLLLLAALSAYGRWRSGRRLGGQEQVRLLRRSIKTGRVAEGADRDRWRAALARNAPRRRRAERWGKPCVGIFGLLVVVVLATGVLNGELLLALVTVLPLLVLLVPISYLMLRVAPKQRRAIEALERELAEDD